MIFDVAKHKVMYPDKNILNKACIVLNSKKSHRQRKK